MHKDIDTDIELEKEYDRLKSENEALSERLERITEISAAIIYILDVDGYFVFVNRAVENILHFSPEELIGKHFSTIMPVEEYERVSRDLILPKYIGRVTGDEKSPKLFDERRTGVRRTRNLEVRLLTKKNDDVKFMVGDVTGIIAVEGAYDERRYAETKNKTGCFLGSQGVIFDITKYKEAEKERMELQKRLYEIQKMDAIGRLSGKVAHDLNNKLSSILGCAEIITSEMSDNDELKMYIETIISASRHAAELSNRLMEFSSRDEHLMIEIPLIEIVEHVVELIRSIVKENIEIIISMDRKIKIKGNPNQVQNAILNLVTNACDSMADTGGVLKLSTDEVVIDQEKNINSIMVIPGKYLALSINDTGSGMGKKTVKQLFKPFFTTKAEGKGLGLGLASVRDCMRLHNGFVDLKTEPGKGSDFRIYFPVYE
ncbi:MAG: PAS domain S-box protein [Fibrobacter sp.]|nr:PAS domain S-box protein [Fibrobacter sp.]